MSDSEQTAAALEVVRHLASGALPLPLGVAVTHDPDAALARAWEACANPLALIDVYGWALPVDTRVELGPVRCAREASVPGYGPFHNDYVVRVERCDPAWSTASVWLLLLEGVYLGSDPEPDRYMHTVTLRNYHAEYAPVVRTVLGAPPTLAELLAARSH